MAKSRDSNSGVYVTNYSPAQILVSLSKHDDQTTAEIRDFLDSSHSTALKKLHSLTDMGIVNSKRVGNAYVWELNTDPIPETVETEADSAEVKILLSETISEIAGGLAESHSKLPESTRSWIDDRGVANEVSLPRYGYRMALFRRVLHSVLYSLHRPEHSALNPLSTNGDLQSKFELARKYTHDTGLSQSAIDKLLVNSDTQTNAVLLALRHAIAGADNPAEALADTYEELVPQDARRDLGQFATPPFVSRFMASWAVQASDDTVLDPGIGAGQLAAQALTQKAELGAEQPLSEIVGIDVDEIAISMASVTLKLIDGLGQGELRHGDFIQQSPLQFGESSFNVEQYDTVIANPPYSRHQALDNHIKDDLNGVVSRETDYGFSQRTPLYGYFIVHAAQFLAPGGRLAAIIPSRILDTKFGKDLKEYLLEEFTIHGVIQLDGVEVFESVKATPSIILLEKGNPADTHQTQFIRLNSWDDNLRPTSLLTDSDMDGVVATRTDIAQRLLSHSERWSFYLGGTEIRELPEAIDFVEIATIKRGIATGANDYFCLTQEAVDKWEIPRQYRRPIIRTARGMSTVEVTMEDWERWKSSGDEVWLLYCYDSDSNIRERSEIDSDAVLDYLDEGADRGVKDGYLVSNRDPWYRVEKQDPAPILGKYMNRTGFLFMRNDADLRTLNNVHAINLDFEFEDEHRDALLAYLNSNVIERVLSVESHDYNGLQKLEISQLEDTPVIDPRKLSSSKRRRLANLFNYLCRVRRMDLDDDKLLRAIGDEIEPLLGLDADSLVNGESGQSTDRKNSQQSQ